MTRSNGGRAAPLDRPVSPGTRFREQCEAYADSTGERCQHTALDPLPYCGDHKHLLDEIDLDQVGLKPPKSEG